MHLNGVYKVHRHYFGVGNAGEMDKDLINRCLERFLYVRCYDSLELLATLKTLNFQLQTGEEPVTRIRFLLIDSIGAHYWVDRATTSLPLGSSNRKILSLQSMVEAVVHEIQNSMQIHPMLVLAAKATIFGDKSVNNDNKRTFRKWFSHDLSGQTATEGGSDKLVHREYMPSAWQSFITHRIFVQPSKLELCGGNYNNLTNEQVYLAEWLQPALGYIDKFVVRDAGISSVS